MGKWLAGILATVVGGVILFLLTQEGGPFNPRRPPPSPRTPAQAHITITAFDADPAHLNGQMMGRFTVYNDSETLAEGCHIYFGKDRYDGGGINESAFGVPAKQSTTISTGLYWTGTDPNTHSIHVVARAMCKNGVASDTSDRVIPIIRQ
jgi:hypothetical protein